MNWNIDPTLIDFGPLEIRWYGFFFMIGLYLTIHHLPRTLKLYGLKQAHASALSLWLPIGMVIGAHLVHLIFYEPRSFIDNPRRIIEIGSGLASHGGALGTILTLAFFCRKKKVDFHRYLDGVIAAAVWCFPWVRVGNFFNSEIYGRPTDMPWGIVFERLGFTEARHPSQLYEAITGFLLVGFTEWLSRKYNRRLRPGATFYVVMILYFLYRFVLEYFKEYQALSPDFPITMGQILSLPFLLFCSYMAFFSKNHNIRSLLDEPLPSLEAQAVGSSSNERSSKSAKSKKKKKP